MENNKIIQTTIFILQRFLPLWILLFALIGFLFPTFLQGFSVAPSYALALIFLLMGMSISIKSFITVFKRPKVLFLGIGMKWIITFFVSVALAYIFFRSNSNLAAGIILAGAVPSGTSANLYTLLAEGTVALSVTMAGIDTFIAPFMTPFLMQVFAGKFIPLSFWPFFLSIVYIVFVPLMTGIFIQWKWGKKVDIIRPLLPLSSIIALLVIVLGVVVGAYDSIIQFKSQLPLLTVVIFFQVVVPMFAAYYIARLFNTPLSDCKAMIFHIGTSNTALSATLAMDHISPLAAVPSVINMVLNLAIGALVVNIFNRKQQSSEEAPLLKTG